jgi:hypothetical protein
LLKAFIDVPCNGIGIGPDREIVILLPDIAPACSLTGGTGSVAFYAASSITSLSDLPLEGDGFEPPVPRAISLRLRGEIRDAEVSG